MPSFEDLVRLPLWLYEQLGVILLDLGLPPELATLLQVGLPVFLLINFCLFFPVFTIWLERKLAARFQDRLGPNRVGPFGLFQTVADVLKLFTKELIVPAGADKVVYFVAPVLSVVAIIMIWAVIPFMGYTKDNSTIAMVAANLNVGVIYVMAVSGLGTLAIMMGGWSSNNKYALLGAFRTAAQLLSYEVPLLMALLIPVMLAGSMSLVDIVEAQRDAWFVLAAPVAALLFFVTSVAEVGRAPFDLMEAESEIVAGFHVEYGGMTFGMFFLGEFMHAFTISALTVVLFFGGWYGPFSEQLPILGIIYFLGKTFLMYFVVVWLRSTLPRIRVDHMMAFNWKFLVPLSLALVIATALLQAALPAADSVLGVFSHLALNVILMLVLLQILRVFARMMRNQDTRKRVFFAAEQDATPLAGAAD